MKVSGRLSWGFKPQIYRFAVIYSTCWGIQNSFSYCSFICISFSTWVYDQQVVQIQFCSLLEGNTWSIQVGFKPAIWVTKQQDFTHDESCLPDQVRIILKISTIHEVWLNCPKSIKLAIFKYRYQIYNWNFESKLKENCKYISVTIMKCVFLEKKKD